MDASWSEVLFWTMLIGGVICLWVGARRDKGAWRRNRRRPGVLHSPANACERHRVECAGKVQ